MNNKKAMSFFIVIFFIAVLGLITIAMLNYAQGVPEAEINIGEDQQRIIDAYGQATDIQQYAQRALKKSIQEATLSAREEHLEQEIKNRYTQLLSNHPVTPTAAQWSMNRNYRDEITLEADITLGELRTQTTTQGGIFTTWPVNHEPTLTSLFGTRDITHGSTNHPGIDIRAPAQTTVFALAQGEVTSVQRHATTIQHENGWTCSYLHINPATTPGQAVTQNQEIGVVAPSEQPHLDLRCYNHEQPLHPQTAITELGENHFANPYQTAPADTVYAAAEPAADHTYIDPYCLFSDELRLQAASNTEDTLSGFNHRAPADSLEEQLEETCNAYQQAGILQTSREQLIQALLEQTIEHEGTEFTDHELDFGGATKYGITQDTLQAARGQPVTTQDVQALTRQEAEQIYEQRYLKQPGIDQLPTEIIPVVFDAGVLHGNQTALNKLARVLEEQGHPPASNDISALADASREALAAGINLNDAYVDARIQRHHRVVEENPSQQVFLEGWLNRAESYRGGWSGFSELTTQTRPLLQTRIQVTSELTSEDLRTVNERESFAQTIEQHPLGDNEVLPSEWVACTQYTQQLPTAVNRCAQELPTSCSCALPLPAQPATITPLAVYQENAVASLDWHAQGAEGPARVWFGMREEDTNHSITNFTATQEEITFTLEATGEQRSIPVTDFVYVQLYEEQDEPIFLFSNQTSTASCTYSTPETYCREEQEIRVERRQPNN